MSICGIPGLFLATGISQIDGFIDVGPPPVFQIAAGDSTKGCRTTKPHQRNEAVNEVTTPFGMGSVFGLYAVTVIRPGSTAELVGHNAHSREKFADRTKQIYYVTALPFSAPQHHVILCHWTGAHTTGALQ